MTSTQVNGVLDMTFLDIREELDFQNGFTSRFTTMTLGSTSPSKTISSTDLGATSPSRKKKAEPIKAIRLANNYIVSIDFVLTSLSSNLDTSLILWLDLSFNTIKTIAEDFSKVFPNITTVYLHANKIVKLKEIKTLAKAENLKSLSLYGNPVEEHKHYRNFVLYSCPKLTTFDMSPVTKSEIARMEVWSQTFRKKLNPEIEEY